MSQKMTVQLSSIAALAHWGENAPLSFTAEGAVIHCTDSDVYSAIQRAARKLATQGLVAVELQGPEWDLESIWSFVQGFRDSKSNNDVTWAALVEADEKELNDRILTTNWTRELINKTAEEVAPRQLTTMAAEFIKSVAPAGTVTAKIIKDKDLLTEGWTGIYAVGRGSERTSAMLQLDYNPTGDADAPVFACLVGKGITFDSGGYSIKPSGGMASMKADMGGSALATAGLAMSILRGLDKRVKLILCCAENMISGRALKLGDIITYKNGKTVEILNTDAEGRLVLADGLQFASAQNPELIIDCATLTGAAKMAVGNDFHSLLSFDNELSQKALTSAQEENEGLWRLPLMEFHRTMLPSNFADLANIGSGAYSPGASTAAGFLSYFVEDYQKGWMHMDCSATYRTAPSDKWSAGATGVGVRTLANILTK
ncbi:aminopeptidase PepB [Aliivibrio finisterrensis]|uniref:aminopeptidase PepB n=1 Tax=Aliivibrio finisterrensis TaxID=511998 RepID=UPI001021C782|nr:aminopeptidase PepB [Aliivibrio finisterrensis]RYU64378.1 aminopeptidase PepB [Aliivibrio finisterrensis]RYU67673.1 aminopeptidase PepB [Aliivibrio finisterrensis]RYU70805.1 aminopeptidase PepB [Aliivibrio finisterrensis]